MKQIFAGFVILALVSQAVPGWASEGSTWEQAGYGAGSVLGTLVYAPLKATFCILGGIGAGFTAIASPPTAGKVFGASCGGTWIITPDVVRGDEPVQFVGSKRGARAVSTSAVAAR
jgi:hypothetical protein